MMVTNEISTLKALHLDSIMSMAYPPFGTNVPSVGAIVDSIS